MITSLCKFFLLLQQKPGWLFSGACLATALAFIPLHRQLQVRASVVDILPPEWESVKAWKSFGQKFGSAGHLTVVVHSPNPRKNLAVVENLAKHLQANRDVNFLEYRTESDFYRRHKLLYISLTDLREIERRVETGFWINRSKRNPLILDLLSGEEKDSAFGATNFEDLETKYFSRLKDLHGSRDSTILVLRIYPSFDVTDIHACRQFFQHVQSLAADVSADTTGLQILYSGDVFHSIQNEGRLFSNVLKTTRVALVLSVILLLINFLRFPAGTLLALIPVGMAVLWTLALTQRWLGPLGIITTPLGLLLIGLGLAATIHLLARYAEERRKRLTAKVAFETITLETGPAIAAGLLTLSVAFLTFRYTDFRALGDFGLMAGIGMVCTLVAVLAVFPSLLRLVEPLGLLNPMGKRLYNIRNAAMRPFRHRRLMLSAALLISVALLMRGPQWRFQNDFTALGFGDDKSRKADSLIVAADENLGDPAVFLTPTSLEAQSVAEQIRAQADRDSNNAVGMVTTMRDLLPDDQEEKLRITDRLRHSITPDILQKAREPLRSNLVKLKQNWPSRPLETRDLPLNYRLKFLGKNETRGVFVYVFPAQDSKEGINSLRFANQVRSVNLGSGHAYYAGGWPVVYGDLVARMVPESRKAAYLGVLAILLVLLVTVQSLRGALVLILPVLMTMFWMLGTMKWLHLKLNPYNLIAFPVAMAYATMNTLHLHHRYEEEGRGSLPFVFRRTGRVAVITTVVGAAGFIPMIFAEHRGLASLGLMATLGLVFSLLSSVLLIGGVFGVWEAKRLKQEKPD